MTYNRPTLSKITTQIENDIYTRFGGNSRPVRFSVNKILARVIAGSVHLVYGYIDFCMKQIIVDTATSEYLDRWALVWGLQRKSASKAEGFVVFTGIEYAKIPAFTQIQTSDYFLFQTLFEGIIEGGKCVVKIQALKPCVEGNMKGGIVLNLVSPIANVQANCVLEEKGTYSGTECESNDLLRARILDRIRNAPCAGNKKDYETWCLQIAGNTRAWCYPQYQGEGNVGLTFTRDNEENIIPNETQLQNVFQYISSFMPCTATLKIFAPSAHMVDFTIKSTDLSQDAQTQITDQLKFLFFNVASPNNTIYISDILEALSSLKTITRMTLISPLQDVVIGNISVGVVGRINLQGF